ncbi:DUF4232 domain-containing protein [Streptomyces sp. NPDC052225]|uniref:DUF4232 domain-containing protein n=1 Tax=Streptomyces sp. NPDC052225 TaxID=3154949 RepID=UPI003419A7CA
MRRSVHALPVLAATALLLTACGTERPQSSGVGGRAATPSAGATVDDPGKDGVRITSLDLPEGVAGYEVTNDGTESLTYSVVVTFADSAGGAVGNETAAVRDVGPGKTVRGTVRAGALPPGAPRITRAEVLEVTKVPAGEAPAASGSCPESGVRVSADRGDAAMGLRVVGLHLDNCGTREYTVDGYPLLELLDDDRAPVTGVEILDGSSEISTALASDTPPHRVTLRPGESATASLVWRNTTGFGDAVDVPYVRVRAKAGAAPVTVTPHLDLGTTGKLGVTAWKEAGTPVPTD